MSWLDAAFEGDGRTYDTPDCSVHANTLAVPGPDASLLARSELLLRSNILLCEFALHRDVFPH